MPKQSTIIKVFIASPDDLKFERDHIPHLFTEWNLAHPNVFLLPVMWELSSVPELGKDPQGLIIQRLIPQCDLLIAMFWTKIGTRTSEAKSGTIQEIDEFIKQKGAQQVMLYFCERDIPQNSIVPEAIEQLDTFKKDMKSQGLYQTFKTQDELEKNLYKNFHIKINEILDKCSSIPKVKTTMLDAASIELLESGLSCKKVYAPVEGQFESANKERNEAKVEAIKRSIKEVVIWNKSNATLPQSIIWIVAEAGPAYLSINGCFRKYIENFVANGGLLRVILSAPWGLSGENISRSYHEPSQIDPTTGRHVDLMDKYEASLRGCVSLVNQAGSGNVELRICNTPVPCTLLVTTDRVFFEPYVYSNRSKKLKRRFDTFELEFEQKSPHVNSVWTEHLRFLWCCVSSNASQWLSDCSRHEDRLIEKLRSQCEKRKSIDFTTERIPLFSEHDTWISVDPLVGCPARCKYCYVEFYGLTNQKPTVRCGPEELVHELQNYLVNRNTGWDVAASGSTPICVGNYTDMLMSPEGRDYFLEYAELHSWHLPDFPLCVITKSDVQPDFLRDLDKVGCPILLFLSQSFIKSQGISNVESSNTCNREQTIKILLEVKELKNITPIHFWRPITQRTVTSVENAKNQLEPLQKAGCLASVAVGLKCGPGLGDVPKEMAELVNTGNIDDYRGEYFPNVLRDIVYQVSNELQYPVYRNTSCAIALALKTKESLGTWGAGRCVNCFCCKEQRGRCKNTWSNFSPPSKRVRAAVAKLTGATAEQVNWNPETMQLEVKARIRQNLHSRLVHLTGVRIKPSKFDLDLAWPGWILLK